MLLDSVIVGRGTDTIKRLANYATLTVVAVLLGMPLFWALATSLSPLEPPTATPGNRSGAGHPLRPRGAPARSVISGITPFRTRD